jgi:phospholipid/cholesterol/gamma-HCH transport system ATP-binding protein
VSLKIEQGETFVIIGLSGAGKTVILRHIVGLLEPDVGSVLIEGTYMNGATRSIRQRLRDKMGFVFQSGALINWLSVWDNLALPLVEKHYPRNRIDEIVSEKLKLLQLFDAKDKMPSEISGGMRKRVSLARALVTSPEIILYDEPTSGLDPVMSSHINELIRDTQERFNVTSIVVTHDMRSAYYIADRIAVLYEGQIVQCDKPEVVKNTTNPIVQQFITGSLEGPIPIYE